MIARPHHNPTSLITRLGGQAVLLGVMVMLAIALGAGADAGRLSIAPAVLTISGALIWIWGMFGLSADPFPLLTGRLIVFGGALLNLLPGPAPLPMKFFILALAGWWCAGARRDYKRLQLRGNH